MRRITEQGLDFIKGFEKFEASPYICPAGKLTIGFGRLVKNTADFPRPITIEEGLQLLAQDVAWAERAVLNHIRIPLMDFQFDALVSFAFNCGGPALQRSTARRRINRWDLVRGADALRMWCKGGRPLRFFQGLFNRRDCEREMFLFGWDAANDLRAAQMAR